jgi:5'-nucleotidase/UDP-sugar diphosphatase
VPGEACQPDRQNGTWIVQAHEWGKYVGRADFEYRQGEFKLVKYALIPINLKMPATQADSSWVRKTYTGDIAEDKDMLALLSPYQAFGQLKLGMEIGSSDKRLEGSRPVLRTQAAAMGVLVGLASIEKTKADFAVTNAGGVRESLPAGRISYKDVLKVHPFGNTVVTVDLSGEEVIAYLNAVAKIPVGAGAYPQFAGIKMVIYNGHVSQVLIKGEPVQMSTTYRMVLNSFQAIGGDGYPSLIGHKSFSDSGFSDAEVLRAFIVKHSPLKAADYEPGDAVVRR